MSYWIREIVGWLLSALGLYGYWITLAFLAAQPARLVEGMTTAFISTVLFRGGLSLVRVASAARVLLDTSRSSNVDPSTSGGSRSSAAPR